MLLIKIHTVSANSNLTTNNNPRVNVLAWNRFTETLVDYLLPLLQNRPEQDHPTKMDCLRLMSTVVLLLCISNGAPFEFWNAAERDVSLPNHFLIDEEHKVLVVAGKNSVCHVSLDLQNVSNIQNLQPEDSAFTTCTRDLRTEDECQNYNHVLTLTTSPSSINTTNGMMTLNNTVLLCGSNAFRPVCHYRERGTLMEVREESGDKFCPYNQYIGSSSLWLSTGSLVSASPTDPDLGKVGISISDSPFEGTAKVTSKQDDIEWLYRSPHFVSMHEIGEHVYIFFSEEAAEASGDSVVYSRVARVCKNDLGTMDLSVRSTTPLFLTYIKARISCTSSSGQSNGVPFHFNNIQDTFYLPSSMADNGVEHMYAVFTSPKNGPVGSTVCYYTFYSADNIHDIGNVFSGDYRVRLDSGWDIDPNYEDFTCEYGARPVDDARNYQLMANTITQENKLPLLLMSGYTFHKIVVDQVQGLDGHYREVMFVAARKDGELVLVKSAVTSSDSEQHVSQTIVLGSDSDVTQMILYGTGMSAYVYIGTSGGIYRVSGSNCDYYKDCCSCIAARDPYCAFDMSTHQCTEITDVNRDSPYLVQDVISGDSTQCVTAMNVNTTETTSESMHSPTSTSMCQSTPVKGSDNTATTTDSDATSNRDGTTKDETKNEPSTKSPVLSTPGALVPQPNNHTWPIVGAVSGFIGGVVIGIILMALFYNRTNFIFFRRKRERQYTVEEPETEHRIRKHSKGRKNSGGASNSHSKEEEAFKNNSGNFTGSGTQPNDYTMVTPMKVNSTHSHMNGHVRKCSSPAPSIPVIPDPKALNNPINIPTPTPPTYNKPINVPTPTPPTSYTHHPQQQQLHRASTGSMSNGTTSPYRSMVVKQRTYTDPNLKSNLKQVEHITNQQRATYGSNLLARSPSIDAKHNVADGYRTNGRTLPYKVSYSTDPESVRISGAEMSCSQC